jgi:hypothetical protein
VDGVAAVEAGTGVAVQAGMGAAVEARTGVAVAEAGTALAIGTAVAGGEACSSAGLCGIPTAIRTGIHTLRPRTPTIPRRQ